jgi:lysozyme family protein
MAAVNYDEALRQLLLHEGGYTHHPSDPGGPTNFGITIYDYRKYVKQGATAADVKTMSLDEAKSIYRAKYWDAQRCDELPTGVDNAVFDYGVNSGIGRSGKVLRRCLKLPDDSSIVNDTVIAAAIEVDAKALVIAICDERLRFLKGLKTWGVFGKGWGLRVAEVKAFSLALAGQRPTSMPKRVRGAQQAGKGVVPVAKAAQQGSAGAVAAAGAAAANQAHASGTGAIGIAAVVAVAIVAAIAAHAFWSWRQRRQQEAVA